MIGFGDDCTGSVKLCNAGIVNPDIYNGQQVFQSLQQFRRGGDQAGVGFVCVSADVPADSQDIGIAGVIGQAGVNCKA